MSLASHGYKRLRKLYQVTAQRMHVMQWLMEHGLHWGDQQPAKRSNGTLASVEGLEPRLLMSGQTQFIMSSLTGGDSGEGFTPKPAVSAAVDLAATNGTTYPLAVQGVNFIKLSDSSNVTVSGATSGGTTDWYGIDSFGNSSNDNNLERLLVDRVGAGVNVPWTITVTGLNNSKTYQVDLFSIDGGQQMKIWLGSDEQTAGYGGADYGVGSIFTAAGVFPTNGQIVVNVMGDSGGNSRINAISVTSDPGMPAAPSGLSATAASSSMINLAWTDSSIDETNFVIDRATDSNFTQNLVTSTVAPNVTTYSDTGLSALTTYYYRVRATNSVGDSANTSTASAQTPAPVQTVTLTPSQINANNTHAAVGSFSVNFDASALAGATITSATLNLYPIDGYGVGGQFTFAPYTDTWLGATGTATAIYSPGTFWGDPNPRQFDLTSIVQAWASGTVPDAGISISRPGSSIPVIDLTRAELVVTYSMVGAAPTAPSNLTATAASTSQIDLAWVGNSNTETGFIIDRATDADFTQDLETFAVGPNVTTCSDTGLSASTTYYYRVRATNASGDSANSSAASATTQATSLAAPGNLTATAGSSSQINLTWTDNANNETGYHVWQSTDGVNWGTPVDLAANTTSYQATGLNSGQTYHFKVTAYIGGNDSAAVTASATTQSSVQAATLAPSQISATNTHAATWNFSVNFDASALAGATITNATLNLYPIDGYGVSEHFTFAPYTDSWLGTAGMATTIYSPGTYWGDPNPRQFDLTSIVQGWADGTIPNAGISVGMPDNGIPVIDVTRATLVVTYSPVSTAPTAPSNLAATAASTSQVDLSWTDNSNTETSFIIDRATDADFTQNIQTFTVAAGVTTYSDTGLSSATKYYYRVRSGNSFGESDDSGSAHAATQATTGDSATFVSMDVPTNMVAGQTYQVTVTMRNTGNNTWTADGVWRLGSQSPQDNTDWGIGRVRPSADAGTCDEASFTFDISAPAVAGTYTFNWRMVHEYVQWFGDNTPTATIMVTGEPAMPVAPSDLAATAVLSSEIDLQWVNNSNNQTSLIIERSTSADFSRDLTTLTVAPNVTSYSDSNLAAGTTYYYRIHSSNLAGASDNSAPASAVTAAVAADSAVFVGWNLPSTMIAGQTYTVTVTMRNTGSNIWTADGIWRLGSQTPPDNYNWGVIRVQPDADFATGQEATFTFDIAAPAVAGDYAFNWRMVHEYVQWFGDSPAAIITVTGAPALPAAPTDLATTTISAQRIDLIWADESSNETSFIIERSTSADFSRDLTTLTTAPNVTGFSDTSLAAGTTYYYRVRAANLAGQSESSNAASSVTPATTADSAAFADWNVPATMVTGQTYTVTVTMRNTGSNTWTADGLWRLGSQAPQDNYDWGIGRIQPDADAATGQDATFTFEISAPAVAGQYDFNWRMVDEYVQWFGNSTPTLSITVTGEPAMPAAPSGLTAAAVSSQRIDLQWADDSTNETSFVIERSTSADFSRELTTLTAAPNTTSFSDTNLAAGTTYYYRVRSSNLAGQSGASGSASAITAATTADSATFVGWNVPATISSGLTYTIAVTMRNTGSNTWTADGLWRLGSQSPQDNTFWGSARIQPSSNVATGQEATFTFDIVAPEDAGQYAFGWRLVHDGVQWFGDSPATTVTVTRVPLAPSGLAVSEALHDKVTLTWVDNSDNETAFAVERATDPAFTQNVVTDETVPAHSGTGSVSYTASGLDAVTRYYFRVRATNGNGSSGQTDPLTVTTPDPPAYDGFDYTVSDLVDHLNGGSGWADAWRETNSLPEPNNWSPTSVIASGSLTPTPPGPLMVTSGNSVSMVYDHVISRHTADQFGLDGTTLWASYVLRVDTFGGLYDSGGFLGVGGLTFGVTYCDTFSTHVAMGYEGGDGYWAVNTPTPQDGTNYFLVAKIEYHHDTGDLVSLYLNPDPTASLPDPSTQLGETWTPVSCSTGSLLHLQQDSRVRMISDGYNSHPGFDEVRLGDSYAAVTPPAIVINSTGSADAKDATQSPFTSGTNAENKPEITLRSFIEWANSQPGKQSATFNIPNNDTGGMLCPGVWQIYDTEVPVITDSIGIQGGTQLGFTGTPVIVLGGKGLTFCGADNSSLSDFAVVNFGLDSAGIELFSSNNVVFNDVYIGIDPTHLGGTGGGKGLVINDSAGGQYTGLLIGNNGTGIQITGNLSTGNVITSARIGLDDRGAVAANGYGVVIENEASNNRFTDSTICGSTNTGVWITKGDGDAAHDNVIDSSKIGLDTAGNQCANADGVVIDSGAANNRIQNGSVISGNTNKGIWITGDGTTGNKIWGSWIGIDKTGTAFANAEGILIDGGASDNFVGTDGDGTGDALEGNRISGNTGNGVRISGDSTSGNHVSGNKIGDPYFLFVKNGGDGVLIEGGAANNVIGISGGDVGAADEGNIISGNEGNGVHIVGYGTDDNRVTGNQIGINGCVVVPNGSDGVLIENGATVTEISDNTISGNEMNGVHVTDQLSAVATLGANKIGTNAAGTSMVPNGQNGVLVENGAIITTMGTDSPGDLLISGNTGDGVRVTGVGPEYPSKVFTLRNVYIGTDNAGAAPLGNGGDGLHVDGGGYVDQVLNNIISGNGGNGLNVDGTDEEDFPSAVGVLGGNFIGTDKTGVNAVANTKDGVLAENGGIIAHAWGNVISACAKQHCMRVIGSGSSLTIEYLNFIGTNLAANVQLGNGDLGVLAEDGATVEITGGGNTCYGGLFVYTRGAGCSVTIGAGQFGVFTTVCTLEGTCSVVTCADPLASIWINATDTFVPQGYVADTRVKRVIAFDNDEYNKDSSSNPVGLRYVADPSILGHEGNYEPGVTTPDTTIPLDWSREQRGRYIDVLGQQTTYFGYAGPETYAAAPETAPATQFPLSLWGNGPVITTASGPGDVKQGHVGDCWFLASLAAFANLTPTALRYHAVDMGDGTYAVEFFINGSMQPIFERVSNLLPVDGNNKPVFAQLGISNTLWAAIFEKAYAYVRPKYYTNVNESDQNAPKDVNNALRPSYWSLNGGFAPEAYWALGGLGLSSMNITPANLDFALLAGQAVTAATPAPPPNGPLVLVTDHVYTLMAVNLNAIPANSKFVFRNPWGEKGADAVADADGYTPAPGAMGALTWAGMVANFGAVWVAAGALQP